MNSFNIDRILRKVLVVPIVAVLLGACALYWQMHQANRTVALIQTSDLEIAQIARMETLVIDEETGLRGYQNTRDRRFLGPYLIADKQMASQFERLRAPVRNTDAEHPVNDLQTAFEAWDNGFAVPLIAAIEAGANTSDVNLNLGGKHQMDDVRRRIAALSSNSQRQRDAHIQYWRAQVRTVTVALIVVALCIGLLIGVYTRRLMQDVSGAFRQSNNVLRIRAEETFRSEQKLLTTLQSIGDGVITCDVDGRIQTMNDVAQELTGWTEAEAHNLPLEQVFKIINESTREPRENPVAKVKRLNRVVGVALHSILIQKNGAELFIDDSGAPIRDKRRNLVGVVLVFRDITLAKKSQEALLANEKLAVAGRLAATIAHEIHNPLDSVANLLYLMDGQSTPEESAQFLHLAKQEIARVTQISRAMLSLYRESSSPVAIDLKNMLESILLLMDRHFQAAGVSVVTNLPTDLVIQAFPAELRQVFTNLLHNAAEASASNGVIQLAARPCPEGLDSHGRPRDAGVMVTVTDHGAGVPEEIRSKLFKPFFTTKGERGTGLGLWISRGIITKHGGEIDLASSTDPITHGTKVSVFLATNPTISAG